MNFIVALLKSEGCSNIMIITDRLFKDVSFAVLLNLEVEMIVQSFIKNVFSLHEALSVIVSDWGSQFINEFWARFCEILNIQCWLSTVFHPQTDEVTERMNSIIELMLKAFSNWNQTNWAPLLPMIQLVIKNYIISLTEVSPFFLLHGYELDTIQVKLNPEVRESLNVRPLKSWADTVMNKMRDTMKFAQAVMINVQQEQECQVNHHHWESPQLCVSDKVWLVIGKQYSTGRSSWKLNYKNQKYTVMKVILSHAVHFDIKGVHSVFHVNWFCLAADNALLNQPQFDDQSASIYVNSEEKWYINEIITEEFCCHDCYVIKWLQVKYTDYAVSEWNWAFNMEDTAVLEQWMEYTREFQDSHSKLPDGFRCESCPRRNPWCCH